MAITKLKTHDKCPVKAILGPFGTHYGRLKCATHNTHIQWLNKADFVETATILGKFENKQGTTFDTVKSTNGVKERPVRQKPKHKDYIVQRKYGSVWNTEYSFTQ